jgi:hypothetical protein
MNRKHKVGFENRKLIKGTKAGRCRRVAKIGPSDLTALNERQICRPFLSSLNWVDKNRLQLSGRPERGNRPRCPWTISEPPTSSARTTPAWSRVSAMRPVPRVGASSTATLPPSRPSSPSSGQSARARASGRGSLLRWSYGTTLRALPMKRSRSQSCPVR